MPKLLIAALLGLVCAGGLLAASRNLEIYWIDAEGGAATLIVSPSGESLLVDTANRTPDDRDAKRIFAAAQQAGLHKIDMLLTTHFHSGQADTDRPVHGPRRIG
jgi:competence protein ComEC